MFYYTSKRPLHSLQCDLKVTEYGEFSNCFAAITGYVCEACIFAGEEKKCFKIRQIFPIIEKCKMKPMEYALGHLVYIGTGTKNLGLLVEYMLCF